MATLLCSVQQIENTMDIDAVGTKCGDELIEQVITLIEKDRKGMVKNYLCCLCRAFNISPMGNKRDIAMRLCQCDACRGYIIANAFHM